MLTVKVEGAVPLTADKVSHLPPSAVLLDADHCSVPVPPFRIGTACAAGLSLVVRKKLNSPGRLSKKVAPDAATVKVTGTVSAIVCWKYWRKTISPI